jgi:hypothetical protein
VVPEYGKELEERRGLRPDAPPHGLDQREHQDGIGQGDDPEEAVDGDPTAHRRAPRRGWG